jgi:hypothetical protein
LNVSKGVAETAEFKTLQEQNRQAILQHQMLLKSHIVSAAKMEIDLLHRRLATSIVTFVGFLSKSLLITSRAFEANDQNVSAVCSLVLRNLNHYKPTRTLSASDIQKAILPYSASPLTTELDTGTVMPLFSIAATVSQHINDLCIAPCAQYTEQETVNHEAAQIKALASPHELDALAAETALRIDDEPTVEPKLLEAIIDKAVDKALARRAYQQLSLKEARGATDNDTSVSASLKKKKRENDNNKKAAAGRLLAAAQNKTKQTQEQQEICCRPKFSRRQRQRFRRREQKLAQKTILKEKRVCKGPPF